MFWINESSGPEERELAMAWVRLISCTHGEAARVSKKTSKRITAAVRDSCTFGVVVRQLFRTVEADMKREFHELFTRPIEEFVREMARAPIDGTTPLESSVQALYFFLRRVQDAAYCALLESGGGTTNPGTSMGNVLKKDYRGPVREILVTEIPGYVEWFGKFRRIRNDMKEGLQVAKGLDAKGIHVHLVKLSTDNETYGRIYLPDVAECLSYTVKLLKLVESVVAAGGLAAFRPNHDGARDQSPIARR